MDLSAAVQQVKRNTGYGSLSVTNDQSTTDIINEINNSEARAWRFRPWHFSWNERRIVTIADEDDYTLEASDGYIELIYPETGGLPLPRFTRRRYFEWIRTGSDAEAAGSVVGYLHNGRS